MFDASGLSKRSRKKNLKLNIKPFGAVAISKSVPIKKTEDILNRPKNKVKQSLSTSDTVENIVKPFKAADKPIETVKKEETIQLDLSSQGVSGLSLSSLKIQKEHKNKFISPTVEKQLREKQVNQDSLEKHWEKFSEIIDVNGEKNMVALLQLDSPRLKNKVEIHYAVPNDTNRFELEKNSAQLMAYLRNQLSNDALVLKVHLEIKDEKKFVYTSDDKYKVLSEKNPVLDLFMKKFNLEY